MSRSRKDERGKKSRGGLSQYGLFDIGDMTGGLPPGVEDGDIDDDDLEAELDMILGQDSRQPLRPVRKDPGKTESLKLDSMIAASMRDIASDEELSDTEDPSILAELSQLTGEEMMPTSLPEPLHPTPVDTEATTASVMLSGEVLVTLLSERYDLYSKAEQAAKLLNDSSKARRYKRGLDQLKCLMRQAECGDSVSQDDIPVPVVIPRPQPEPPVESEGSAVSSPRPVESVTTPLEPPVEEIINKQEILATLTERLNQYKLAALSAKRNNDIESALSHIKVIKQFEVIIQGVERGQPVDLSTMPAPPASVPNPAPTSMLSPASAPSTAPTSTAPTVTREDLGKTKEAVQISSQPPEAELTVLGALESRLAKYAEQEDNAKKERNASKARRMGRIVKQYREAITLHNRGKPIPVDELPTPPGFPPIPVAGGAPTSLPSEPVASPDGAVPVPASEPPTPVDATPLLRGGELTEGPSPTQRLSLPAATPKSSVSPTPSQSSSKGGTQTRIERQLALLLLRQKEYKEAALRAKQAGDLVRAKEYLRLYKGFDSLVEATRQGLPVDMDTIPKPISRKAVTEEDSTFEIIRLADCIEGSDSDIYDKLITDLRNQLKMCLETYNHFKAIGDIGNANRFENLAGSTKKDYNLVRSYHATNAPPPRFHYEKRSFTILRCNVDLNDNDLELNILKGINYNVANPKEIDTYIKYEFPYPNDEVRIEKTSTVYNTNNPEYNATFLIPIQRSSRPFQRLFKRHSLKLHLWSKGGFLRSDQLLGTAQVKLQPLETKCTLHDAVDVLDGRRPMGGKIEVKLRLRNPIASKQMEQINEKWLVID